VITFSKLTFSVPGAGVQLAGTYDIHTQKIDMQGHLRMQAKLSQTVTGKKSFFLKAIDPFFSKNGAGTELPITITGTQDAPVFGVSVFHKKFEKQMGKPAAR
jgi:VCBS repeat-containing protein